MPRSAAARVLVVEDDEAIRMLVREVLTDAGYDVREARSGREGLDTVRSVDPQLIVLDKLMPDLDGDEFALHYRKMRGRHAPIIALSAASDAAAWAERIGAAAYIGKPLDIDDLLRVVAETLASRR